MLALAFRYLLVAVVVGAGFAMLQGSDWLGGTAATGISAVHGAPRRRA